MQCYLGGASLDLSAVQPKPFRWISDISWLNLVELSKLKRFQKILEEVCAKEMEWKPWHDLEMPETVPVPCGYGDLDTFRKLLVVRSWCPDRTLLMAKNYVIGNIRRVLLAF
jgi:dynein heavy chain